MSDEARVVGPDGISEFETPPGEDVVVIARGDAPGGDYDLLEITVPSEFEGVPPHVHHDTDEVFYVLEGEILLRIGEAEHRLARGSYAFGPRGVPHSYRVAGDGSARMLVLFTPGSFVRMNEELEELGPFDLEDGSDMERMLPILESYGIEMTGPPSGEE